MKLRIEPVSMFFVAAMGITALAANFSENNLKGDEYQMYQQCLSEKGYGKASHPHSLDKQECTELVIKAR